MPIGDPSEPALNDRDARLEKPASSALVPVVSPASRWTPNAAFVAHLMAYARRLGERRRVQRASPLDAQAAYRTRNIPEPPVGRVTRQVI